MEQIDAIACERFKRVEYNVSTIFSALHYTCKFPVFFPQKLCFISKKIKRGYLSSRHVETPFFLFSARFRKFSLKIYFKNFTLRFHREFHSAVDNWPRARSTERNFQMQFLPETKRRTRRFNPTVIFSASLLSSTVPPLLRKHPVCTRRGQSSKITPRRRDCRTGREANGAISLRVTGEI